MPETGIQWSATDGHMQVGVNFRYETVGASTTNSKVYCDVWVRSINWGFNDPQEVEYSGSLSGTFSYTLVSPGGTTTAKMVGTVYYGDLATSYSGGPSRSISVNVNGAYDGSDPTKNYTFTLPARPASAPSAPNSSWSSLGATSVVVNCSTPSSNGSSIDAYQIQVDNHSDFSSPVGTYARGATVPLTPGVKYYIRSRAHNGVGWSTWSTVESFTALAAVPSTPSAPTISDIENESAKVTWSAPSNNGSAITGYNWKVTTDAGGTVVVASGTTTATSVDVTGLDPNTNHYAFVQATNSVGSSPYSAGKLFKTSATGPSEPGTPTFSGTGYTSTYVNFTEPTDDGGSEILDYEIQLATNNTFNQNLRTVLTDLTTAEAVALYSGLTWYVRVRAINAAGPGAWSTVASFNTLEYVPEIVSPANGAVASVQGALSVVYQAFGLYGSSQIEVEVSKGAETYTRVLNLSGAAVDYRYTIEDLGLYLGVGTWNVRARSYNEQQLTYTAWSPVTTFVQSHTPTAQVVSPIGGQIFKYAATTDFRFTFVDPAGSRDRRTAYQYVVEVASSGAVIYDSGKVASVGAYGTQQLTVSTAIAGTYENVELRWRVRVWDNGDTPSAWSGYSLFTLAAEPDITITAPVDASTVLTGAPTITWTADFSLGATQFGASVSIIEQSTGEPVFNKSVTGGIFTVTPESVVLTNLTSYTLTITVLDTNGVSGEASVDFSTAYESPDPVGYNIDASEVNESGYVLIEWRDAIPDASFVNWKVYRRISGSPQWELLTVVSNVNTREYRDYMVVAGTSYLYTVTQTAVRSGEDVESPIGYREEYGSTTPENRSVVPPINNYWLIDTVDNSMSVMVPGVSADNSTLEFEDASYNIIGRGRHVDYGDELGYSGTLESKVRVPENPSTVRLKVEALRRARRTYFLRTPNGRLFSVALGNITWAPLAGAGTFDMGDMSIPYLEVK